MARISICIPAYKPDFFELALKSAIAQSYEDTEILVSDDCPSQAIASICERYDRFVSYSRNPSPGECSNVIRLSKLASGEYIKYLFDDDIIEPFCIQYLVEALETTSNHQTIMAFSPRYIIDESNRITSLVNHFGVSNEAKIIGGRDFVKLTALTLINLVGEFSTVLLRRQDCFDEDGQFRLFKIDSDGTFRGILDLSSWLDLARRGNFIVHPQPLSYFRQHSNSTSNHQINPLFINGVLHYEDIMERAVAEGYLDAEEQKTSLARLIHHYRYWQQAYPQLTPRIAALASRFQRPAAPQ